MTGIIGGIGAGSRSGVVGRLITGPQIGSGTSNPGSYAGYPGPFLELKGTGPTLSLHDSGTGSPQWEMAAYNQELRFSDDGVDRVRILSTGGLAFGSDSAEANALDDYEEGGWEPSGGWPNAADSYGVYTKIGRMVYLHFTFRVANNSGATNAGITGMPFQTSSSWGDTPVMGTMMNEQNTVTWNCQTGSNSSAFSYTSQNSGQTITQNNRIWGFCSFNV